MKLSIIVPVYNVEQYLERCVDSLLRQDLDDYEIILVNDCSTDRSGTLCEEIAAKSDCIRVFHHETNKGLGLTRNTGIDKARGEYLYFVDSDDFIEENSLRKPYEMCKEYELDMLGVCAYITYLDGKRNPSVISLSGMPENTIMSGKQYLVDLNGRPTPGVPFYMIKKSS